MSRDKLLGLISIAKKAGALVSGDFAVNDAIKKKEACLVIVAGDASDRTKKDYTNACEFYDCELLIYSDRDSIGAAIGQEQRVSIAITDEGLAASILKKSI